MNKRVAIWMNKNVAIWAASGILNLLVGFGLCFAGWWLPRSGEQFGIGDVDTARRTVGILMGIYFMVNGNGLPKGRLVPPSSENSAVLQLFLRLFGWACVLAGVVFVLAWLVLPVRVADGVSTISAPLIFFAALFLLWRRMCHMKGEQRPI